MILTHSANALKSLNNNKHLLYSLVLRDIKLKYASTTIGFSWLVIQPLLMLATYTLVFGVIFKSRWNGNGTILDYVLTLFAGLTIYVCFSDTINRATTVIRSQPNFIKKVVFPVDILPIVVLGSSLFNVLLNIVLVFVMSILFKFTVPSTFLLFPFVLLPFVLMLSGITWCLAALSVFILDTSQVITFLSSVLLFLSPVFFPIESAPKILQPLLYINPVTIPIQQFRSVVIFGNIPNLLVYIIYFSLSVIMLNFGFWAFSKSKSAFADFI